MRYLIILLLFLTSCPHKTSSFDWGSQPYQNIVPPPIGRWAATPTISYNGELFSSQSIRPDWALNSATSTFQEELINISKWCDGIGYKIGSGSDIDVYFYYEPYTKKTSSIGDDCLVIVEPPGKATSTASPPAPGSNYSGVAIVTSDNRTISHVDVWLNINKYQVFYDEYKIRYPKASDKELKTWAVKKENAIFARIIWHELGHALFGLSDDSQGSTNGTMVYATMTIPYNTEETAVIKWMYGL
jgi:hypothetical protein